MKKSTLQDVGAVLLEGWLFKSPPENKMKNIKSWCRRYFVLIRIKNAEYESSIINNSRKGKRSVKQEFYLIYWKNENVRKKGERPIRAIPILKDHTIHVQSHPYWEDEFPYVIVFTTNDRKFFLCAEDEQSKDFWYNALTHAVDLLNGNTVFSLSERGCMRWSDYACMEEDLIWKMEGRKDNCQISSCSPCKDSTKSLDQRPSESNQRSSEPSCKNTSSNPGRSHFFIPMPSYTTKREFQKQRLTSFTGDETFDEYESKCDKKEHLYAWTNEDIWVLMQPHVSEFGESLVNHISYSDSTVQMKDNSLKSKMHSLKLGIKCDAEEVTEDPAIVDILNLVSSDSETSLDETSFDTRL